MNAFLVTLAVFLAAVLAVSAIGKLRAPDHGRAAFEALRIPVALPGLAAAGLIIVEAGIALALLFATGWFFVTACAAAAALMLGLLFAVVRAHRMGVTDDCGCFGDWLPASIGGRLITRNIVLSAIAIILLLGAILMQVVLVRDVGVPFLLTSTTVARAAVGALLAALLITVAIWSIVRATMESLAEAAAVPAVSGAVVIPASSEIVDLLAVGPRARLLLFVSAGCHACAVALASIDEVDEALRPLVDIYVVQRASGGSMDVESSHVLPPGARFALDVGGSLGALLGVGIPRPVAALIGTDGAQAGPLAIGSHEIALLAGSIAELAATPAD
ncbi:MauE/DoxX family redox-associated membrane protein [Microbacterium saperdae]